jgi:hypothetical protein
MRSTIFETVRSFVIILTLTLTLSSATAFAQGKSAMSPASPMKPTPTPAAAPAKAATMESAKEEPKKSDKPAEAKTTEAKTAEAKTDDASVATAVKEKIASMPSLKDAKIDATVKDGVVTLTGSVKAPGLKGVATNAAKRVKGVKSVTNNITIDKPAKDAKKDEKQK